MVLPVALLACIAFAVLLQPERVPLELRQSGSAAGLVLSGAFLAVSSWLRARQTVGRRRRSWLLITAGALIAIAGNVWATAIGSDPVESPSAFSNLTITVALVLCIAAVLGFPSVRRRGIDLVVMTLDGLVIGGSVLIIANTLVYSELLDRTGGAFDSQLAILLIPVLDVVLVVVGLLLVLRTRGPDRRALALLALGFLSYAAADLPFAVAVAQRDFAFGTTLDLGWIGGYVLLALAAWYPSVATDTPDDTQASTEVRDALLVYAVLIIAAVVQVGLGSGRLGLPTALVWLVLALAASARQLLLILDNSALRRDLEDRVREQTADLERMARQTEVLLTSVGDGIYGVDTRGRITFVNPSGASALRYTPIELLGRDAHDFLHAPDEQGAPYSYDGCYIAEAIRTGSVTAAEEDVYIRSDGTTFDVEITASPLVDEDVPRGAVVVFRDITQRREVDRMKNEFISVVSHELRTPLTSIRGSLDLLSSGVLGELSPQAQSMTSIAVESSERLTRLINDMLDLERIESGASSLDTVPVDARDLLERSATEMAGLASSTRVRIEVGDSAGRVVADRDRIVQTLTNLLSNAIKFSEPGQTVVLEAQPQDGQVVFGVRDEGRGIPAEKLDVIFKRFEQVDSSDARQKGGTGLGLAISRGIVERHGGRIWAESELGSGTTVLFTLPSARAARPSHGRSTVSPEPPTPEEGTP
ncbi:MAG TPA: ATP-binding protein [Nocardioides sp.]|nr:ATP-binding protein [Nocardioides sp.]